jgi:hypothetical protein
LASKDGALSSCNVNRGLSFLDIGLVQVLVVGFVDLVLVNTVVVLIIVLGVLLLSHKLGIDSCGIVPQEAIMIA